MAGLFNIDWMLAEFLNFIFLIINQSSITQILIEPLNITVN